jgi:hypothetical protein
MKKVLLLLLVVALAVAGIGVYVWNKPHETVEDRKALVIAADSLANAFLSDEQQANQKFLNQVIEVTGTVLEAGKNQDGKPVITLGVADPLSGIQCTMRENNVVAEVGKRMTIKGFCNGYTLVVLLSDCIVK